MSHAYGTRPPGYRLPDATHLGCVRLQVSDLARSLEYYEHVLGFHLVRGDAGFAALAPHGEDHVVVELHEDRRVRAVPQQGRLGLYHFAVLLPTRAALGRFLSHLAEANAHAGMSDHYVSEAIYLQDPDNLGIEVYADRPRDTWQVHDGQLAMSTVPLDVQGLLAAAEGERWTGMPAGTRLGHVHLHVGDIARAAAFYHEGLGLDKIVWSYPGALFLSAGGYHHHLGTNTWARNAPSASAGDARLLEWEIVLPAAPDVQEAGTSLEHGGNVVARDGATISARDPWGTQVRITCRK